MGQDLAIPDLDLRHFRDFLLRHRNPEPPSQENFRVDTTSVAEPTDEHRQPLRRFGRLHQQVVHDQRMHRAGGSSQVSDVRAVADSLFVRLGPLPFPSLMTLFDENGDDREGCDAINPPPARHNKLSDHPSTTMPDR